MGLDEFKIASSDYTGRDVSGLADRPALSAAALKARFDSLVKNVVAVKYNGLVEALKTALSGLCPKITGGVSGNFTALASGGTLADSGKKAADFEPVSISRHSVYKAGSGSAWYKILSFPAAGAPVVGVEGFSCAAFHYQRGHWKLVINRDWENYIRADLIYASNGITPDSFDVRLDGDTIKLYFYTPHYTLYRILSETFLGSVSVTTFDTEETPSGTAVSINYADTAVIARRRVISASVTLSSIVTQYEVNVSWAAPGMWFEAIRTDATMTYFLHPIRAFCESAGKVKVYLNAYPDTALNGTSMGLKISGWM